MAEQTTQLPELHIRRDAILPDNEQWTNRFQIKSESSNSLYVVSQSIANRHWGCSCPGWRTRRNCKHLKALGIPGDEKPYEPKLVTS